VTNTRNQTEIQQKIGAKKHESHSGHSVHAICWREINAHSNKELPNTDIGNSAGA
jgi:hypothetical protein